MIQHRTIIIWTPWTVDSLNGNSDSVNGDLQFLWELTNFNPHKMDDPEPIDKNRHCWLRPLEDPYTKFGTTLPTDGFSSNGWSITEIIFFNFIFFSEARVQFRPVNGFLRAIAQKTWSHAGMCLFGVIKLKFNINPLFIRKNRQSLATMDSYFRPKTLNNGGAEE